MESAVRSGDAAAAALLGDRVPATTSSTAVEVGREAP